MRLSVESNEAVNDAIASHSEEDAGQRQEGMILETILVDDPDPIVLACARGRHSGTAAAPAVPEKSACFAPTMRVQLWVVVVGSSLSHLSS